MATFDDIYEVEVEMRLVTEEMRKAGVFMTKLRGYVLDFNPYKGIYFIFTDAQPMQMAPIVMTKVWLTWPYIVGMTVLPKRTQRYDKKNDNLY